MTATAAKDPQQAIGRSPDRLSLDERRALIGKYVALEIYTPEDLPLRRIEAIGDNPHYDRKDPYAYFEQFKSEPQTLGDELAAMLIEFGLDLYQIKDVLRYAEKDAKLTLGKTKAVAA